MELPENFASVMKDFTSDLKTTFPEYAHIWWIYGDKTTDDGWKDLYSYCLKVYPESFFDILYQNDGIFKEGVVDGKNTFFLPRVDFKKLYFCEGVSEKTQQSIWKYLQLILFMVIGNVKDKSEFGKTMNMFEGIDEGELQSKMSEAMSGLGDFFKNMGEEDKEGGEQPDMNNIFEEFQKHMQHEQEDNGSSPTKEDGSSSTNSSGIPEMPNPEDLHNHIKGLFGGKLGSLAQELMEELQEDLHESLGINPDEIDQTSNPADILKKLMRHPDKLMKLVQKIQNKFQQKMSSGDLSQEDLMKEAGEMLRKMKDMGGNSKQMNEMFKNMAQNMGAGGNIGKNMKVDTNRLDRMLKSQDIKDRLRSKLDKKKKQDNFVLEQTKTPNNLVYRPADDDSKQEKTFMTDEQINAIAKDIGDVTKPTAPKKKKKHKKPAA
jgi:hypothetical protein